MKEKRAITCKSATQWGGNEKKEGGVGLHFALHIFIFRAADLACGTWQVHMQPRPLCHLFSLRATCWMHINPSPGTALAIESEITFQFNWREHREVNDRSCRYLIVWDRKDDKSSDVSILSPTYTRADKCSVIYAQGTQSLWRLMNNLRKAAVSVARPHLRFKFSCPDISMNRLWATNSLCRINKNANRPN